MKPKLFFRTDASQTIGRGHLSRCLAIAEMLKNDFEVCFIVLDENVSYINNLNISFPFKSISLENEIFNHLSGKDIVWLDGYQFSETYKKKLKDNIFKLIETNDIPYEAKNVDILINHTPGIDASQFGNSSAKLCLGLDYALLRPSFLKYARENQHDSQPKGKGIFVCFGGADSYDLGLKFVERLLELNFKDSLFWVSNLNNTQVLTLEKSHDNLKILNQLDEKSMIDYMLRARVLLIPSSVLSIESMALRKAFFTGYYVDNQQLIFKGLKEFGLAECFGYLETQTHVSEAARALLSFYDNFEKQEGYISQYQKYLSGNSSESIRNTILQS